MWTSLLKACLVLVTCNHCKDIIILLYHCCTSLLQGYFANSDDFEEPADDPLWTSDLSKLLSASESILQKAVFEQFERLVDTTLSTRILDANELKCNLRNALGLQSWYSCDLNPTLLFALQGP